MHIELVATDGKTQKRVLWVDYTSNGVYAGYCSHGNQSYSSYHADGNFFIHGLGEKPTKVGTYQPLDTFKGSHQIFSTVFTVLTNIPYNLKKLDALVSVDSRNYPKGIGCSIELLEPNNSELLGSITKPIPEAKEVHLFLECKPWLSMVLYGLR